MAGAKKVAGVSHANMLLCLVVVGEVERSDVPTLGPTLEELQVMSGCH